MPTQSAPVRRARSHSPATGVGTPESEAAASSGEAATSSDIDEVSKLEALADDLLRQVAERDVELEQLQEELEATSASTGVPYADPLWLKQAPKWLRALAFAGIMALVLVLPSPR